MSITLWGKLSNCHNGKRDGSGGGGELENYIYGYIHTYQMIYIFVFIGSTIEKNEIGCALSILLLDQIKYHKWEDEASSRSTAPCQ